jgi:hexosaminidase
MATLLLIALALTATASLQPLIPSVASFIDSDGPGFVLSSSTQVVVDSAFQNSGSPSLINYAQTFRDDLISVTGFTSVPEVKSGSVEDSDPSATIIFLTLGAENHTYFNGVATDEGYDFTVSTQSYIIKGSGAIGAWWGER